MRVAIEGVEKRWVVAFSGAGMIFLAVMGGMCREFLERLDQDFPVMGALSGSYWEGATLSVIGLLFIVGMAGNVGVLVYPAKRWRGTVSGVVVMAVMILLLGIAVKFGLLSMRFFMRGQMW